MRTRSIQTTTEVICLLETDFKDNLLLKDKHFYFIDTLIRRRADRKPMYLDSQLLKKTFGDRCYLTIINYFIEKGIVQRYYNKQDSYNNYYTYKFLLSTKKLVDYQITSPKLIRTIDYFYNTNYENLRDFEKQVLHNIQQLQLPSEFDIPRLYMTKSKNTGRLFHSIVNMPRNQRIYLKHIDGIRLGELDGKNAQLVMLSHLFNDDEVFNDAVYGGEFYKMLSDEMGVDISLEKDKNEFKRKFFNSILFNENRLVVANSKYSKAFEKLFPITFHNLLEMQPDKSKATELQRTESNLFIDNITRDLVNEGLFVIPIHDAVIFNLDEIEKVQKIINDNCYSVLGRPISLSLKEFCPTIDENYTTYNNLYKEEGDKERDKQEGVYVVQNDSMVGQNKKTLLREEKVVVVTQAIKQLMSENQKITVRKIKELSGVAKATVEKHYKTIISEIIFDNKIDVSRKKEHYIAGNEGMLDISEFVNEDIQNKVIQEQDVIDSSIDILNLTANEIGNFGYSDITFKTSSGQMVFVPKVYLKYWDGIKVKLGLINRLAREYDQLGFDIELRRVVQSMVENCIIFT